MTAPEVLDLALTLAAKNVSNNDPFHWAIARNAWLTIAQTLADRGLIEEALAGTWDDAVQLASGREWGSTGTAVALLPIPASAAKDEALVHSLAARYVRENAGPATPFTHQVIAPGTVHGKPISLTLDDGSVVELDQWVIRVEWEMAYQSTTPPS